MSGPQRGEVSYSWGLSILSQAPRGISCKEPPACGTGQLAGVLGGRWNGVLWLVQGRLRRSLQARWRGSWCVSDTTQALGSDPAVNLGSATHRLSDPGPLT